MKYLITLCLLARVPLGLAVQPNAASPPKGAKIKDLEFGDLNFLHSTDTHGWHGGHLKEGSYSADWGDYITFSTLMRKKLEDDHQLDLIVVDTGDKIRGNGLYGADPDKDHETTYKIFKGLDLNLVTIGNHELYNAEVTRTEQKQMVEDDRYKDSYLVGNLEIKVSAANETGPAKWAQFSKKQFTRFVTPKKQIKVTAMGIVYNTASDRGNDIARVIPVEHAVKDKWFLEAVHQGETDVFVVVGHVPARPSKNPKDRYKDDKSDTGFKNTEFKVVYDAIRNCNCTNSNKPIQFLGGDYHIRDYQKYDNEAFVLASGMYLETIGFASITGFPDRRNNGSVESEGNFTFTRKYIDNNIDSFRHHLGLSKEAEFTSTEGDKVTKLIRDARTELELDKVHGCSPTDLWMSHVPYEEEGNLYRWLEKSVFFNGTGPPSREGKFRVIMLNSGAIRYNIAKGEFTKDTAWSILPFESPLVYLQDMPWHLVKDVPAKLNKDYKRQPADALDEQMMKAPHLRYLEQNCPSWQPNSVTTRHGEHSQAPLDDDPPVDTRPLGYVTKDAIGPAGDGDDTVHKPICNFDLPAVIHGYNFNPKDYNPETVDLVFNEYLQPRVLGAMIKPFGPKAEDDKPVKQEMRDFIVDWVEEHWKPKPKGGASVADMCLGRQASSEIGEL